MHYNPLGNKFDQVYKCRPVIELDRENLNLGDRLIMPANALEEITRIGYTFEFFWFSFGQ